MTFPFPDSGGSRRYHSLDNLRAWMMLLGLALHAALPYAVTDLGILWPYKDSHTAVGFDVLVALLHSFRMPLFFVLAGFFGAMLVETRGPWGFFRNRLRRILLPLLLFWPIVFPLTMTGFAYAIGGDARDAWAALVTPRIFEHLQLLQLWFLLDLMIYYTLALGMRGNPGAAFAAGAVARRFGEMGSHRVLILMIVLSTATLLLTPSGVLETPGTFRRPANTLLANGVFFAYGWLLFHRRTSLPAFGRNARSRILVALLVFPLHLVSLVTLHRHPETRPWAHGVTAASGALVTWLFLFGFLGLFVRRANHPSRRLQYVSEASYWLYVVHLPVVIWTAGFLSPARLPATVKYALVLGVTVALALLLYDTLVRPGPVGSLLNGRRLPRTIRPKRLLRGDRGAGFTGVQRRP